MEEINETEGAREGPCLAESGKRTEIQDTLKKRVITVDDFPWRLPSPQSQTEQQQHLKYVGGVDVSFSKEDPSMACGSLVVLDLLNDLRLVYQEYTCDRIDIPYVPGFLAFREAPILVHLLEKMKNDASPFYPQSQRHYYFKATQDSSGGRQCDQIEHLVSVLRATPLSMSDTSSAVLPAFCYISVAVSCVKNGETITLLISDVAGCLSLTANSMQEAVTVGNF
ncbi:hypothetical protein F3Y22_tig00116997pilonHSYRG00126 [Hibiscus syriacus]|uniref:Uncharacterized protein n=1 Tax=Hibiscus syriacus TaxID=106335 RepID=A0A6A2WE09_HIBSY|nr:hypothetical protein F3Y22_tig00116997pilonHSYRG00126 [Hibiscus syriacus]